MAALVRSMTGFAVEPRGLRPIEPAEFAHDHGGAKPGLPHPHRADHGARRADPGADPAVGGRAGTRVRRRTLRRRRDDLGRGGVRRRRAGRRRSRLLPQRLSRVRRSRSAARPARRGARAVLGGRHGGSRGSPRKWCALEALPVGTLGRGVADFYRDRGFVYPGLPGSAPPLLAQHDWVHVLAGYGTTLENELEVFAFIARANDDPRGFSLLAMIVSLFETGNLATGAGLFEANPGHLHETGMAVRIADAMRRGALMRGQPGLPRRRLVRAGRPSGGRAAPRVRDDRARARGDRGGFARGLGGRRHHPVPAELRAALPPSSPAVRYLPWAPDPSRA